MKSILNKSTVTLIDDSGVPRQVTHGHPNFHKIRKAVLEENYEEAIRMMDIKHSIENASDEVTVNGNDVMYKGHKVNMTVAKTLVGMISEGLKDITPWTKHIELLMQNPNSKSREELYDFLSYKGLPIDENGYVYGYRGVDSQLWSLSGNTQTIVLQGTTDVNGKILNAIGATIEVDRGSVDGDRDRGCSNGLHIGSFDYAKSWAGSNGRVILVKFNPKDAVSVPSDCEFQKLRVCKYEVVKEITENPKELKKSYYESNTEWDENSIESEIEEYLNEWGYNIDDLTWDDLYSEIYEYDPVKCKFAEKEFVEKFRNAYDNVASSTGPNTEDDFSHDHQTKLKIERYRGRNRTTGAIQKNLGIVGLTCENIAHIAEELGMTVDKWTNKVSKWVVN